MLIQNTEHDLFLILYDDIYGMWWHLKRENKTFFRAFVDVVIICRITRSLPRFHLFFSLIRIGAFAARIHAVCITRFPYDSNVYSMYIFFRKGGNTWLF